MKSTLIFAASALLCFAIVSHGAPLGGLEATGVAEDTVKQAEQIVGQLTGGVSPVKVGGNQGLLRRTENHVSAKTPVQSPVDASKHVKSEIVHSKAAVTQKAPHLSRREGEDETVDQEEDILESLENEGSDSIVKVSENKEELPKVPQQLGDAEGKLFKSLKMAGLQGVVKRNSGVNGVAGGAADNLVGTATSLVNKALGSNVGSTAGGIVQGV
ncbi:uncharacterized protein VTP21DRAFT_9328 [Calcarisporiella thermophila]|uniref:uncharacterized protein n=1 Tax=Calcarisporiella thermophila TaxID=911321 RepID=UPI003743CEFB